MVTRGFFTAIISLFLLGFPGYSFAVEDHSGHGGTPVNSPAGGYDSHSSNGGGQDQHGTGAAGHDTGGSGGYSSNNPEHGGQDAGHGNSGKSSSSLEPVKNPLVGGFIGINALIVAVAAYLKFKLQRGVAG